MMTQQTSDDKWGYFRPGYFPVQDDSIAPAMVCLSETHGEEEPNVQFILVKADCYLKVWEDALFISENDFDDAKNQSGETLNDLMASFMKRGYLPLNKLKNEIQFMSIH